MAIEIVAFPIKDGDFPVRYVSLPEGKCWDSYSSTMGYIWDHDLRKIRRGRAVAPARTAWRTAAQRPSTQDRSAVAPGAKLAVRIH